MNKKWIIGFVAIMLFLAGCSDETNNSSNDNNTNENKTNESKDKGELEELATYEIPDEDALSVIDLKSSFNGNKLIFTAQQTHKRDKYYDKVVITAEGDIISSTDHTEKQEEFMACHNGRLSPDGQLFLFECSDDDAMFTLYDLDKEDVIHSESESDSQFEYAKAHMMDIAAVTDDQDVIFSSDADHHLSIYDIDEGSVNNIDLPNESNGDIQQIKDVTLSQDNMTIFMSTGKDILEYDRKQEEFNSLLDNVKDETKVGQLKVSGNGTYVSYLRNDSGDSKRYILSNLDTGEKKAFNLEDPAVYTVPDNDGNIVVYNSTNHEAPLQLFNMNDGTTKKIPLVDEEVGVEPELNLSADGKHLFVYENNTDPEASQQAFTFYRYTFGDVEQYEDAEFDGELLEESKSESDDVSKSDTDGLPLYEYTENVREGYDKVWNDSAEAKWPADYPFEEDEKHYSMNSSTYSVEGEQDKESFEYVTYLGDDRESKQCAAEDLEKDKEQDGIQYYYYDFNQEKELSFGDGENCYTIVLEGLDKEVSYDIADSLKKLEEPPFDLDIDNFKFPEQLPMENLSVGTQFIDYNTDSEAIRIFHTFSAQDDDAFNVGYKASSEDKLKTVEKSHEEIDAGDWDNMTYDDISHQLGMYDGEYYYLLEARKVDDDFIEEHGEETIKQTLVDIAATMNK